MPAIGRADDKVAIITGSTYGIGEAIARVLAREGAASIITGWSRKEGMEVVGYPLEPNEK